MTFAFEDVQTGTVYQVGEGGAILGRERARTDIAFRDESISKRHARIFSRNGQWFIEDLESSNGTYVRNERIFEAAPLRDGAQFSLAQRRFRVVEVGGQSSEITGRDHLAPGVPGAFGQAVLHYVLTLPRLLVMPVGVVRESVEDAEPPGRSSLELAVWGAVAGFLVTAWSPVFAASMQFVQHGQPSIPPSAAGVLVGVLGGGLAGLLTHPVVGWIVRRLGGVTDGDMRGRFFALMSSLCVLAAIPLGATRFLAPLDPVSITVVGSAALLWIAGISLYAAFRWARAMGVFRWVEIAVLVVGLLVIAGGSASAIRSILDLSGPRFVERAASTSHDLPPSLVQSASSAPPAMGTGASAPRAPLPGAPAPKAEAASAASSPFARYVRERGWIEATFDAHPNLLLEPEVRAAYEALLAAEAQADATVDAPRRPPPWFDAHIGRRLQAKARFDATRERVTSLARRMKRALKPPLEGGGG